MANASKSSARLNKSGGVILYGRGKKSTIEEYMSRQKKYEIYNSVTTTKVNKDTVQIFKVQVGADTWYAMKDYKCSSMQLKKIPKNLLEQLGRDLHTKAFNLNRDNVNDLEVLKRLQLSAVGVK